MGLDEITWERIKERGKRERNEDKDKEMTLV